jgi:hypothetical protein
LFNYQPIYIGKGCGNRDITHLSDCLAKGSNYNWRFYKVLRKIINSNLKPIVIRHQDNLSEQQAFELEKQLISKIGRQTLDNGPLLNIADGGNGWSSEECINSNKNNWKIIKSDETYIYIQNLKDWCYKNNFNYNSCKVFSVRKIIYKGCCFNNIDRDGELTKKDFRQIKTSKTKRFKALIYELEFKNKQKVLITNLTDFCNKYEIKFSALRIALRNNTYVYDLFKIKKMSETRISKQEEQLNKINFNNDIDQHVKEIDLTISIKEAMETIKDFRSVRSFFNFKVLKNTTKDRHRIYKKELEYYQEITKTYVPMSTCLEMFKTHNFKLMHLENSGQVRSTIINNCKFYHLSEINKLEMIFKG